MDAEAAFLKAREEREAQRMASRVAATASSDSASLRVAFVQELEAIAATIRASIRSTYGEGGSDEGGKGRHAYETTLEQWRRLQERLASSSDTKSLSPHEMQSWNKTLLDLRASIEQRLRFPGTPAAAASSVSGGGGAGGSQQPTKKFTFSSKKASSSSVSTPAAAQPSSPEPSPTNVSSSSQVSQEVVSAGADDEFSHAAGAVYSDLKDVTVFIPAHRAVFIRRCVGCTFLALPTAGSFFISDASHCRVYLCCHQLRIKSSHDLHVFVWCGSTPVIESCERMTFGPYTKWRGLTKTPLPSSAAGAAAGSITTATHADWATGVGEIQDLAHASLQSWRAIDDFHWLKQAQSPNWCILTEERLAMDGDVVSSNESFVCDVIFNEKEATAMLRTQQR